MFGQFFSSFFSQKIFLWPLDLVPSEANNSETITLSGRHRNQSFRSPQNTFSFVVLILEIYLLLNTCHYPSQLLLDDLDSFINLLLWSFKIFQEFSNLTHFGLNFVHFIKDIVSKTLVPLHFGLIQKEFENTRSQITIKI